MFSIILGFINLLYLISIPKSSATIHVQSDMELILIILYLQIHSSSTQNPATSSGHLHHICCFCGCGASVYIQAASLSPSFQAQCNVKNGGGDRVSVTVYGKENPGGQNTHWWIGRNWQGVAPFLRGKIRQRLEAHEREGGKEEGSAGILCSAHQGPRARKEWWYKSRKLVFLWDSGR